MNTLNVVGLWLVGLFCAGFVLLVVASLAGWKITGGKVLGGLKWLLTEPFRFLFFLVTLFPVYLAKDCLGFLSKDTLRGIRIARKEVKIKMVLGSIIAIAVAMILSAATLALTKSYTGKYFLIDFLNVNEGSASQSGSLVWTAVFMTIMTLFALNLPRRFCRSDESFEMEADNLDSPTQVGKIIASITSGLIALAIFPPIGFVLLFQLLPEMSYFSVMRNKGIREKTTLKEIEKKELNRPAITEKIF